MPEQEETEKLELKVSTVLKGPENYKVWATTMKFFFRSKGLWKHLNEDVVGNTSTREGRREKDFICAEILQRVSEELQNEILNCEEPKEMWRLLREKMVGDCDAHLEKITAEMSSLKFRSLEEMVVKFRNLKQTYSQLGGQTPEHDLCLTFLRQVPKRFYTTKQLVVTQSKQDNGSLVLEKIFSNLKYFLTQEDFKQPLKGIKPPENSKNILKCK
jgi:AAA+ superfamily predicted ATPase